MYKLTTGIIAIMLVVGCTTFRPPPTPDPAPVPASPQAPLPEPETMVDPGCGDLLGYYEAALLMENVDREQELETLTEIWSLTREWCDQLRLALMLSQPETPVKERERALNLLTDLLNRNDGMEMKSYQLAQLLHSQLEQLLSRQIHVQKLKRKLKQERAASRKLLQRLTALQSQLEQLKNIEKSINEKEQAIITPSTDNIPHEPVQNSTGR
ncbi:hypothetical protein MNBD_GAMMA18-1791 [hydrothermal vent metagenome]|uniref:Lipoprotein n=1 Tax=hydrothermal vent metagenome TaxID=652676 RepID=A0A3B0ZQN7_9ZZZZ